MSPIRSVTVYCSSAADIRPDYFRAGAELGAALARSGRTLVYGGNRIGLMGAVADAARAAGGRVVGVTPQLMIDQGIGDDRCDELVVTANMRDRKALLEHRADAFIALPGGLGTLEEFFEILVARLLGYHSKPIILLNTERYFETLLNALEHGIAERFIRPKARQAYFVASTVADALAYLDAAGEPSPPPPGSPAPQEPSALE